MLRHAMLSAIVLVAVAAAPTLALGQETTLKWKFKQGEKFYVEDVVEMKNTIVVLGQNQNIQEKTTTVTSYEVVKITTDAVELKMKIEHVDARSDAGISQFSKIMEKTKGAVFGVTVTPASKVTKFEGFKEFAGKLGGDDPDVTKLLKELITEEMFVQSIEQAFAFVPNKTVKKDDTWTRDSKIPFGGMGEFKAQSTYTYNGKADGGDAVGVKQMLTYMPPKAGTEILGLFKLVKGNMKADNAKGTYIFDAEKGRLVSATSSMTIRGTLTLDLNGQMEITIDLRVEQSGTSKVLDKNPNIGT